MKKNQLPTTLALTCNCLFRKTLLLLGLICVLTFMPTSHAPCASLTTATDNEITRTVTTIVTDGPVCDTYTTKTTAHGLGNNTVNRLFATGSTIYAPTQGGGLSISTDGGASFTTKTTANGLGHNIVYSVYAVGTTVYAATRNGLSISTDGGASFTNRTTANGLGNNFVYSVYVVGTTVYAATNGGLSISTNGGTSFTNKTSGNGLGSNSVFGVYVVGTTVYAGTSNGLSISTDGGSSFTNKTTANGLGHNFVYDIQVDGTTIYAATQGGLSISTDGGASFTNRNAAYGLGDNFVNGVYVVGNTVYAGTQGGLSISTDSGASFTNQTTANGLGNNAVLDIYTTGTAVYVATDGGGLSFCSCSSLIPSVSIAANPTGSIEKRTNVTFTATPTNGGTTPAYQWKKNGSNVGFNSATYTNATLANGDKITCVLTSNSPCVSLTTATSNEITMTVTPCTPVQNNVVITNVGLANFRATYTPGGPRTGTPIQWTAPIYNGNYPSLYWSPTNNRWELSAATWTSIPEYTNNTGSIDSLPCTGWVNTSGFGGQVSIASGCGSLCGTTSCINPTAFNVTGGGTYCASGTGIAVGLSGSESGVSYQLQKGGINDGTAVAGTGMAISFGNKTVIGVYTVVATRTTGGCINNMTGSVTVTVTPTAIPSVSIAANPTGSVAVGTSVTFTATPTNGGNTPTYQWKKNGSNVGINSTTYTDATLANGDKITCILTSNATCVSQTTATSNEITMAMTFSHSTSCYKIQITTACSGFNGEYVYVSDYGGGGYWAHSTNSAYEIYFNSSFWVLWDGSNTVFYNPSSALPFPPTTGWLASVGNSCNGNPITSFQIIPLTKTPSVSIAANPTGSITSGTSVTFTATPTNGGTTPAYQWKKNGNNVGANSTTYTDAGLANGDVITCVLTSNVACASSTTATSNELTITIACAMPTAYNVTGGGAYCVGGTGVAIGLSGSETGVTYQLKKDNINDGTVVNGTGMAISFGNKTAAATYTVVATRTADACTNNMTGSVMVTTTPTVIPSVSIAASPTGSITSGTSVTFTATPTNGGTTPTYQWQKNGSNVGSNSATYTDAALANGDKITCVLTSNAACASPTTATSNETTMTVTPPVANGPTCNTYSSKNTVNGLGHRFVYGVFATGSTIYAATAGGLSISTDGGTSFTNKTTANGLGTNKVNNVHVDGTTIYAATDGGLSISTDGGASFTNKTTANGLGHNGISDIYTIGTTVYVTTYGGGLGISTDGGASFTTKTTANGLGNNHLLGVYAIGTTVYVATGGGLSISTDGGASFINKTTANGLGNDLVNEVYVVGTTVYAATNGGLSISTNSGASFMNRTTANGLGSSIVFDVYVLGTTVYASTSSGISISTDGGSTFTNYSTANGLGNDIVRSVAVGTTIYAATGDGLSICACTPVTPSVTIAANPTGSITSGTSVTFTATPTNGGTTPAYQWKKNGSNVGTNSATYTDAALANGDVISCVLTSSDLCASPTTATSNSITMTVTTPCVTPTAYTLTGGGAYCAGGIGVAIGLSNSESSVTYQLKNGATDVGTPVNGTGSAISFGNQTAGNYTVVATRTTGGCTATMTGNAVVTVNSLPTASIVVTNNCGNSVLNLTTNGTSFLWSNGTTTEDITVSNTATYTVTVTGSNACTATASETSAPKAVPTASIEVTNNIGNSVLNLTTSGTSYAWSNMAATEDITVSISGTYTVTVSTSIGCTTTSSTTVTVTPCASGNTLYVNASVSGGTGDGSTWANAYANLGNALAMAHACSNINTIKVAAGTYKPSRKPFNSGAEMTTTDDRDFTFHIPDGVTIEGGYNASTNTRDITANVTTLSGDIGTIGNSDNAYHVVMASAASTGGVGVKVDGFSIMGGNANGTGNLLVNSNSITRYDGGGIHTYFGNNTLTNNTLLGNNCRNYGAAIKITNGSNSLTNNTISGNTSGSEGGGMVLFLGNYTLSNNTITGNTAVFGGGIVVSNANSTMTNNTLSSNAVTNKGGAIVFNVGTHTLSNNTLLDNTAGNYGGGIFGNSSNNILTNNVFANNSSNDEGGGILTNGGTSTLTNNTFTGNSANNNGGGIFSSSSTNTLTNNIFWENKKGATTNVVGADYYAGGTNGNTFKNNLLQLASSNYTSVNSNELGTSASGNIFAQDPLFVSTTVGAIDLRLQATSPCVNVGTATGAPTTDITGATRVGLPDLGAYEVLCTPPTASIAVTNNCGNSVLNLTTSPLGAGGTYAWSNMAATEDITVSTSGTYTVTVANADGCALIISETAALKALPTASIAVTNNCGNSVLDLTTTGTSYAWSNMAATEDITVSDATTYTVTVTGSNTCTAIANAMAAPKEIPTANAGTDVTVNCTTPSTTLTALGGSAYVWNNGATQGGSVTPSTTITYSVTVTANNGCTATDDVVVTVDKTAPSLFNVSGSGTFCAGENGLAVELSGSTNSISYQLQKDNSNLGSSVTGSGNSLSFGLQLTSGTYTVIATNLTNGCTSTMSSAAVIIKDETLPTFVTASVPTNITLNCTDVIPTAVNPTTTSSCSTVSMVESSTKGTNAAQCNYYNYIITRTWTATDKRGNIATISQVITVRDNTAPTIAPLSNITVTESNIPTTIAAMDNCTATPTISFTETVAVGTPLPCYTYKNTLTRTWMATDICGNTATTVQLITSTGIRLTCPSDKTINTNSDGTSDYNCTSVANASLGLTPAFLDGCVISTLRYSISGAKTTVGTGTVAGVAFPKGISKVTYSLLHTATDACSFFITVVDNEAPKLVLPTTNTIDACEFPSPWPTALLPTASDNCGTPTLEVMSDFAADISGCTSKAATLKNIKSLTRTWKVTDESGNTATATQRIFLRDMVAPTATLGTPIQFVGNSNVTYAVSGLNNGSTDNCTASNMLTFKGCIGATCTSFLSTVTLTKTMIPTGVNQKDITINVQVLDACNNASVKTTKITLKRPGTMTNPNGGNNNSLDAQESDESSIPAEASTVPTVQGEMKCYPTPFTDDLNIQYNLTENVETVMLKVYDTQGRLAAKMEQEAQATGFYQVRWNLSDLQAGMYHICLELNGKCTKMERVIMLK